MKSILTTIIIFLLLSEAALPQEKNYKEKEHNNNFYTRTGYDTLSYINLPGTIYVATDGGYVCGPNIYGDLGKYQRFDLDENITSLVGVIAAFAEKGVVNTPDNINFVVREIDTLGAPGNLVFSETITTDDIDTASGVTTIFFSDAIEKPGNVFIGFEWEPAVDDSFGLVSDVDGDGFGEDRTWEKWEDGQYFSFNSPQSWELDVDLWLGALVMTATGVEVVVPNSFKLSQNYPNPFNPATTINYEIPENGTVTLKIYDILGNEINTLFNEYKTAGKYQYKFEAGDLPSGVYIYKIQVNNFEASKKMILIR